MSTYRRIIQSDWLIDILFLSFLLIIFYTAWLNSYPFFTPDEGRYAEIAREMVISGDYITPRVNGVVFLDKPALYYWLQAGAIHLFGVKEWSLRFFPALFGVLGCLLTYACSRQLFGRLTGLFSAIILATTPLYFACAHYANLDLEVAVLISGSLLCFLTSLTSTPINRYLIYLGYIFAALAVLTKGMIGIVFPALIVGLWIMLLGQWHLIKRLSIPMGVLLFLVILFPWYWHVQKANPSFFHYFFVTQHVTRFLSGATFNNQSPVWFYLPIIIVGSFPWALFLPQTIYRNVLEVMADKNKYKKELFLLLWAAAVLVFFSIPHSKIVSYILPIFPPLAILVGHYLAKLWLSSVEIKAGKLAANKTHQSTSNLLVLGSLFFAAFLIWAEKQSWLNIPAAFHPHLTAIALTFLASAVGLMIFYKKNTLPIILSACTLSTLIYLMLFISGVNHLNVNSAKPLVALLKTLIKPQDEVVNYYKYFYDVPLYLEGRVTVVADWDPEKIKQRDNWARELLNGKHWGDTRAWLVDEKAFWGRWHSSKRIFVFLNANYWQQFKSQAKNYFVLGKYNDIILLSNQPTFINETYLKTHNLLDIKVNMGNMVSTNNSATGYVKLSDRKI